MTTTVPDQVPALQPLRLQLEDQLSIQNRQQLKMRVVDALTEGWRIVVLDASACGYVDASGLGVLVSINKKCREAGGSLVIEGLTDEMRAYLEMIKLDTVLNLAPPAGPVAP